MSEKITCPSCAHDFEITEAISLELRKKLNEEFVQERKKANQEFNQKLEELKLKEAKLASEHNNIELRIKEQLEAERKKIRQSIEAEVKTAQTVELEAMKHELQQAKELIKKSHEHELALRKEKSELKAQRENLDIEIARKEEALKKSLAEEIQKRLGEEQALKIADKDNLINTLRQQINDLKTRSEQGSQQAQGETLEISIEEKLVSQFTFDSITPVGKGMKGSDIEQVVFDQLGNKAGSIIWELKRTKHWSNDWLPKLRDDQRAAKAEFAVIVSQELPKEISSFGQIDGIWVCRIADALPLASVLREALIRTSQARRANQGQQGKMEILYSYLTGPEFKQRIEGIAETFDSLKQDLDREKRAMQKIWAKREKQLERAVLSASGLHGDLQGIIGLGIGEIEEFELEAITGRESKKINSN